MNLVDKVKDIGTNLLEKYVVQWQHRLTIDHTHYDLPIIFPQSVEQPEEEDPEFTPGAALQLQKIAFGEAGVTSESVQNLEVTTI